MTKRYWFCFVWIILVLAALPLFGQQQEAYQEIQVPGKAHSIGTENNPTGRLWVIGSSSPLFVQDPPDSSNLLAVGYTSGYSTKKQSNGSYVYMPAFSPQGDKNLFGQYEIVLTLVTTPTSQVYEPHTNTIILQATRTEVKTLCRKYTIDGGQQAPTELPAGPSPNSDGTYFLSGRVGTVPTLFQLGTVGSGEKCDLRTVLTSDRDIIQAWKIGSEIIAERTVVPSSSNLISEVVLMKNGQPPTVLLGTTRSDNPQIVAAGSIDLAMDWKTQTAVMSYRGTDGKTHAFKYPPMEEVYNSSNDGLLTADIRALDYKSPYLILGGSSNSLGAQEKVVRVNTSTKATYLVASSDAYINGYLKPRMFPYGTSAVTSSGVVYFVAYNSDRSDLAYHLFRYPRIGAPEFPPAKASISASQTQVTEGDTVELTWDSENGNDASIDNGIGPVPLSGKRPVVVDKTITYTLTVKGYNGDVTASVTITATVQTPLVSITSVRDINDREGPVVAGSAVTLRFTSSDSDVGDVETAGPQFTPKLGRVMVEINGQAAWLLANYGNGQVNLVIPASLVGQTEAAAVVKIDTPKYGVVESAPFTIRLVDQLITSFTYVAKWNDDGTPAPNSILPLAHNEKGARVGHLNLADWLVPAKLGEKVSLFVNGCGKPAVSWDDHWFTPSEGVELANYPVVKVGGQAVKVSWAGYIGGLVSACRIDILIPMDISVTGYEYLWYGDQLDPNYRLAVSVDGGGLQ